MRSMCRTCGRVDVLVRSDPDFCRERLEARLFELRDPPVAEVLQRYRIEEMQLFAPAPDGGDEVRRFEHIQMLRHALACHVEVVAQFVEGAAVVGVQQIQQLPPAGIGQRLEEHVGVASLGHC